MSPRAGVGRWPALAPLRRDQRPARAPLVALSLVFLSGCATYSETFQRIEAQLVKGHPDKALTLLEQQSTPSQDHVLFLLNKGMLLRMQGRFEESNATLESAKRRMEELAAVSVSEEAGALGVNEGVRSYIGDPFEQVLVHLIKAFNYLELGQPDAARVEVLQVDLKLRQVAAERGAAYREDAFARYLSGMLYEQLGEWSDALIAYRKAFETYTGEYAKSFKVPLPPMLKGDLLRLAERQGLRAEVKRYSELFDMTRWPSVEEYRRQGHVVVIFSNGLAPRKGERAINLQELPRGQIHRVAIPVYEPSPHRLSGFRAKAGDMRSDGALVESIDAIARQTLKEQLPAIQARALARAVIKSKTVRKTSEQNGALGALVNLATFATERADTRSWRTLPAEIHLARLDLPPGTYDVTLEFLDRGAVVATRTIEGIRIEAGETRYLFEHRILPGWATGRRSQ